MQSKMIDQANTYKNIQENEVDPTFGNKEQLVEDLAQAIFEQDEEQRLIKDI